jgi:Superinfection immunity protein
MRFCRKMTPGGELNVHDVVLGLAIVGALVLYFVPSLVAVAHSSSKPAAIFFVNAMFGWTVAGWIAALVWALRRQRSRRREPDQWDAIEADSWTFDPTTSRESSGSGENDRWVLH